MINGDTVAEVPLHSRDGLITGYAMVDRADAEWASRWKWYLQKGGSLRLLQYAYRYECIDGKSCNIAMHRELMGLPRQRDGREIDHWNHDGLDNRRCNLRVVSHAQNQQNKRAHTGSSSVYRGVYWNTQRQRWTAQVKLQGCKYRRSCSTEEQAREVAEALRRELMPYATPVAS